jgi:hypothetical protein
MLILAGFVLLGFFAQPPVSWRVTYSPEDKHPFGVHALYEALPEYLEIDKGEVNSFFYTFSEMEEGHFDQNVLVLSTQYNGTKRDVEALLHYVEAGHTVLLAAEHIGGYLADSMGISTGDYAVDKGFEVRSAAQSATGALDMKLRFVRHEKFPAYTFLFPAEAAKQYLIDKQSLLRPLAMNQSDYPTLAVMQKGAGALYISSTPRLLTNYYFLKYKADRYAGAMLAPFVGAPLLHNQYYQLGRREAQNPLRYIFSEPALKTAYFILLGGLLLFVVFYGKRRQRIIPSLVPLKNSSLEFASTLGQLYFKQRNHRDLLHKRLRYWQSYVRNHYVLNTEQLNEAFVQELSAKSGIDQNVIEPLVKAAQNREALAFVDATTLLDMEQRLQQFYTGKSTS